jgi:hypothetical protein
MTADASVPQSPKVRVGQPHNLLLFAWAQQIDWAFGVSPLLVGSATQRKDWRDVDIRLVLPREQFLQWVGDPDYYLDGRRQSMCIAFSTWGRQQTGLPIDFQFQSDTEVVSYAGSPAIPLRPFYLGRGA